MVEVEVDLDEDLVAQANARLVAGGRSTPWKRHDAAFAQIGRALMRFPTLAADTTQPGSSAVPGWAKLRSLLVLATLLAVAAAGTWAATAPARPVDPGLARVLGFMALIKAGLATNALAACHWRLARPACAWRAAAYVAGPPVMLGGVILLWSLCGPGLGALGFYLGLLPVLGAAFTDEQFFPDPRPRDD